MATITAAGNGNWSSTTPNAPWPGGTLPSSGDTVEAGGFAIAIDENITVVSIANASGGGFTVPNTLSGTRKITANLVGGTAALLTCSHTTGNTVAVVGNVTGGSAANAYGMRSAGGGRMTVAGNVEGGTGAGALGLRSNSTGYWDVVGTVTGGAGSIGAFQGVNLACSITGAVTGGPAANCHGVSWGASSATLTIAGNVTGGSAATAYGVSNGTGVIAITGNILGGSNATAYGVYNSSTGTLTITGNSTGATATGTYNAVGGTINLTGNAYGSATAAGVYGIHNASTGPVTVTGTAKGGAQTTAYGIYNASTGSATATIAEGGGVVTAHGIYGAVVGGPARFVKLLWGSTVGSVGVSPVGGFTIMADDPKNNRATAPLVGGGTRDLTFALGGAPCLGGHMARRT